MSVTWHLKSVALAGLVIAAAGACAPNTKHAVLSVFFDGVKESAPPATPVVETTAYGPNPLTPVASHVDVTQAQLDGSTVEPPKPRPALESVHAWEEVVAALPRDDVGGVDWVKALIDGLIDPRAEISPAPTPRTPPFTLAMLGPSMSSGTTPPLDLTVNIEPAGAPFYNVPFPHSSHTLWLNCTSCHPGVAGKRPGMQAILRGESCGTCHGKVSFAPETACGRCHVRLKPADEATVTADLARARTEGVPTSPGLVTEGARLYQLACAVCHGTKGDGKGPFASALTVKPRDLTRGSYRFRSTPSGTLATDWDLFRTITIGVPETLMPAFSGLTVDERLALVAFVKSLSPRFAAEPKPEPVTIPARPAFTAATVARGKELYAGICVGCHGEKADGKGAAAPALRDEGGDLVPPFDFTSGRPAKSGGTPEDIYRVLVTGIEGTPMGPFGAGSPPDDNWALVSYLCGRSVKPIVASGTP
jgi:c(7)-type cytochrome triheme protein